MLFQQLIPSRDLGWIPPLIWIMLAAYLWQSICKSEIYSHLLKTLQWTGDFIIHELCSNTNLIFNKLTTTLQILICIYLFEELLKIIPLVQLKALEYIVSSIPTRSHMELTGTLVFPSNHTDSRTASPPWPPNTIHLACITIFYLSICSIIFFFLNALRLRLD